MGCEGSRVGWDGKAIYLICYNLHIIYHCIYICSYYTIPVWDMLKPISLKKVWYHLVETRCISWLCRYQSWKAGIGGGFEAKLLRCFCMSFFSIHQKQLRFGSWKFSLVSWVHSKQIWLKEHQRVLTLTTDYWALYLIADFAGFRCVHVRSMSRKQVWDNWIMKTGPWELFDKQDLYL